MKINVTVTTIKSIWGGGLGYTQWFSDVTPSSTLRNISWQAWGIPRIESLSVLSWP